MTKGCSSIGSYYGTKISTCVQGTSGQRPDGGFRAAAAVRPTRLEALHEKYADRGFAVLGFPANEFGAQEPGSNAEIQAFCSANCGVRFPMFSKIVVKGAGQDPLYAALTSARPEARTLGGSDFRQKLIGYGIQAGEPKEILWNFEKFLLDRQGNVIERFSPEVPPDASIVVSAIEQALGGPPAAGVSG